MSFKVLTIPVQTINGYKISNSYVKFLNCFHQTIGPVIKSQLVDATQYFQCLSLAFRVSRQLFADSQQIAKICRRDLGTRFQFVFFGYIFIIRSQNVLSNWNFLVNTRDFPSGVNFSKLRIFSRHRAVCVGVKLAVHFTALTARNVNQFAFTPRVNSNVNSPWLMNSVMRSEGCVVIGRLDAQTATLRAMVTGHIIEMENL